MSGLIKKIGRHEHSHNRNHERQTHEKPSFHSFIFIETPHKKGKTGKFYVVTKPTKHTYQPKLILRRSKKENPFFPTLDQENSSRYLGHEEEVCPYVRNPLVNNQTKLIYGTCGLDGEQCPGHETYSWGKPSCLKYADFFNPRKTFTPKIPLRFNSEMFRDNYLTPVMPKPKE